MGRVPGVPAWRPVARAGAGRVSSAVAGLIYPYEHPNEDREAVRALADAQRELETTRRLLDEVRDEWSPLVWLGIGVAVGAATTWGDGWGR